MNDNNSQEIIETKQWFGALFDRAAPTYDQVGPRFFDNFGRCLVGLAQIPEGASVLDVATGRGAILFPSAEVVGSQGEVIGIDISEGMVQETSKEIIRGGLTHVEVHKMDAEYLQFPDDRFDYVLCGLSIFFFPQLDRALSEMRRVLKPGGVIGLTTFWRDDVRWNWLGKLFDKYLPPNPEEDTAVEDEDKSPSPDFRSHAGMEVVMKKAGFTNIRVSGKELDFVYESESDWWSTVWSHGMRARLEKIERTAGSDALQGFKVDAFNEIQTNRDLDGFHHMWSVLFTLAEKPLE